tara:strand:+ start:5449 stop:5700 length:252 start_codon:yes stop_codon:yes gene_type:complete
MDFSFCQKHPKTPKNDKKTSKLHLFIFLFKSYFIPLNIRFFSLKTKPRFFKKPYSLFVVMALLYLLEINSKGHENDNNKIFKQ